MTFGPIASRPFADDKCNAIINALDSNKDGVLGRNELTITDSNRFRAMDTNHDGRLQTYEAKDALKIGLINPIRIGNRDAAVKVLLKFDGNSDGYLDKNEFPMTSDAVRFVDGYGSRKYGAVNGQLAYDDKGRVRNTGEAGRDGRVSVSEMANAVADKQFALGGALYFNDGQ